MKQFLLNFIGILFLCGPIYAQEVTLDPSFHIMDREAGTGFEGVIRELVIQEDGKPVVGGRFNTYNGDPASSLIRLHPDGSKDPSFNTGTGFGTIKDSDYPVSSIVMQPDWKLLVGGNFISYNGNAANRLIRLNSDGSKDQSFNIGTGFNAVVLTMVLQPDGKILVGGNFNTYMEDQVPPIIRLNPDGSRDPSFDPGNFAAINVRAIGLQPDAKVLINTGNDFFRLHPDGTMDNSFEIAEPFGKEYSDPDYGTGTYYLNIKSIIVEEDGKILLGGDMRTSLKSTVPIMRLNPDGSRDESFRDHDKEVGTHIIYGNVIRSEEKIYTVGLNLPSPHHNIHRLYPDGTYDNTFTEHDDVSEEDIRIIGEVLGLQGDGKLLVEGSRGGNNRDLFRFNTDGSLDRTYNPKPEFDKDVSSIAIQADGKILAGGDFNIYNGNEVNGLVRIHANGTLDESFDVGTGLDYLSYGTPPTLMVQSDGRVLVIGNFNNFNGSPSRGIVRLNPNGTRDESFMVGTGFNYSSTLSGALLPDGKILLGGTFNSYNGEAADGLIRLNPNGTRDGSFDGMGFDSNYLTVAAAPDGKILVGGNFYNYKGSPANLLVRLNPDGTLDPTFNVELDLDINFKSMAVQSDGKVLIGGSSSNSTTTVQRLIRLNPDGTIDPTFHAELYLSFRISSIELQPDGKILLTNETGILNNRLVRLHPDGSLDTSLNLGSGFNDIIKTIAFQSDGNIMVGGSFTEYNGENVYKIASLLNFMEEPSSLDEVIRINSGGGAIQHGEEEWQADQFYTGGKAYTNSVAIASTDNDVLYQTERNGDFTYEIPVPEEGYYTVELHFSEIHWDRSGARLFDLILEDVPFRSRIDLFKEYGADYAQVVKVEDLKVTDGNLTVELLTGKDRAKISGIAIFKQDQAVAPEVLRINAGGGDLFYGGEKWASDRYYSGGLTYTDGSMPISNTNRDELYHSERFGEFNYSLPVPEAGLYTMELHFAEIYWDREGARVFDVSVENGQSNVGNIDLLQGYRNPNQAYVQLFNIEVTDGTLDIVLTSQVDNAKISGIALYPQRLDPDSPVVTRPEDVSLDVGQEWNYKIIASSPVAGENLEFTAKSLPDQLNLDPATGLISGSFPSAGSYEVVLQVTDQQGLSSYASFTVTVHPLTEVARINSGGGAIHFGEEQWQADQYYTGGQTYTRTASITNTENDLLYQSERNGDFTYDIPVPEEGYYTVELHFAEIHWQRSGARLLNFILENGQPGPTIDLYEHGGSNSAYVLKAENIQVGDGELTLELVTEKDRAKISGIAVYKQSHSYLPDRLRINAGGPALFHGEEEWMADKYFDGGLTYSGSSGDISNTHNDAMYHTERYGNFNYHLPASEEGLYTVELHFAEIYWGQEGARVFNVEIENGQFTLENLDLYKDHGGNSALTVIAENIEVTDGVLDISFIRQLDNAKLSGVVMFRQSTEGARLAPTALSADKPKTEIPNALNPEMDETEVKLYPNPTRDRISLEFNTEENGKWSFVLVGSNGTSTFLGYLNLEIGRHLLEFNLSSYHLSAGAYNLQIMNEKELPKMIRLIIY